MDIAAPKKDSARLFFFPVRHHSPACSRHVRAVALKLKPAAILIEGPADFNPRLDELFLGHRLPIAIYSYVRLNDNSRRGAYYPFCSYSPEWQGLQVARELGATVRFIDLPWAEMAAEDHNPQRYADAGLRRGEYVSRLCRKLNVEDFDSLWDVLFEVDNGLQLDDFIRRCDEFCSHLREFESAIPSTDLRREAFMAEQIRRALGEHSGPILVLTGGFHTSALRARLADAEGTDGVSDAGSESESAASEAGMALSGVVKQNDVETGIALTPYSYERLDSLTGYEAGMPNPGFYHEVWQSSKEPYRRLLAQAVKTLRARGQAISAADVIAVDTQAQGLAALRGHPQVWRVDLIDAVTGALVKEELTVAHPFLQAIHEVFRGGERGQLAEGTLLPPLVRDLKNLLVEHELEVEMKSREIELDLSTEPGLKRSQILHRLRILEIAGYRKLSGVDFAVRDDLSHPCERWELSWSPNHDSSAIEAARYGPTLLEATSARLAEVAQALERDAARAALLLLDASIAGVAGLAVSLRARLTTLIRSESDFINATRALSHLLYLYRYDSILGTGGRSDVGSLLRETHGRGLWLLESLGSVSGRDAELLVGMRVVLEAFERCSDALALDRNEFVFVLQRVQSDAQQMALIRGAAVGALWILDAAEADHVLADLRLFADPIRLGDFLTGLFALAREAAQRHPALLKVIHELITGYNDEDFLTALPSLRLAFTYFTPREKHYLALNLFGRAETQEILTALAVSPEEAARTYAFEARLFAAIERYGLRK